MSVDVLKPNDILDVYQCIFSDNKEYKLCLDSTGDINIIQVSTGNAIYTINDKHSDKNPYLKMQNDGNLVLYDKYGIVWESDTKSDKQKFAEVSDNGSFVIYNMDGSIAKEYNIESSFSDKDKYNSIYNLLFIFLIFMCMMISIFVINKMNSINNSVIIQKIYTNSFAYE